MVGNYWRYYKQMQLPCWWGNVHNIKEKHQKLNICRVWVCMSVTLLHLVHIQLLICVLYSSSSTMGGLNVKQTFFVTLNWFKKEEVMSKYRPTQILLGQKWVMVGEDKRQNGAHPLQLSVEVTRLAFLLFWQHKIYKSMCHHFIFTNRLWEGGVCQD